MYMNIACILKMTFDIALAIFGAFKRFATLRDTNFQMMDTRDSSEQRTYGTVYLATATLAAPKRGPLILVKHYYLVFSM